MIIDQDEHDECFFEIYNSATVTNFDFLTNREINIEEVIENIDDIINTCNKILFLTKKFEKET